MKCRSIFFACGASILLGGFLHASPVTETRDTLKEWIKLEKTWSAEKSEWESEKAILEDRVKLLISEKERLKERIEDAESAVSTTEKKRAELNERKEELETAVTSLKEPLAILESRLLSIHPQLPTPLQEEISKLFARIPTEGTTSKLTVPERLQAVIGILSQSDKFNGGVQKEVEIRSVGDRQAEVQTLYFGLAGAFFADTDGSYAGIGYPTPTGWEWTELPESASKISTLIGVYSGTKEASFTQIPVKLR